MKKVIAIVWIFLSLLPVRIYAANWTELNGILDESLQLVKQEEYEKAEQILTYFSKEFANVEVTHSPEHIRVISMAYEKASQAVIGNGVSQQEKEDDLLALRLVMDAASSKFQPLWLNREKVVMTAFSNMEQAMKKEEYEKFQHALNEFLYQFDIIYPSLQVTLPSQDLQRMNAHLSYLDEFRHIMAKPASGQMQVKVIKEDLHRIFQHVNKDDTPSLLWVIAMTGGFIIFTLTYVGWRKYRGEREKRKNPIQSKNE
ncbi:sporulation protein YpjB [Microbacteriaceae bacterium 4G12]